MSQAPTTTTTPSRTSGPHEQRRTLKHDLLEPTVDEQGFPLVLVHGLGATRRHWAPVAPALASSRRVVTVDLPGFGDSPPDERFSFQLANAQLVSLLRELNLERCVLVGHSMGGLVTLSVAREAPDLVSRIVLVDAQLLTLFRLLRHPLTATAHPVQLTSVLAMVLGGLVPARGAVARMTAGSRGWRRMLYWPVASRPEALDENALRTMYANATSRGINQALADLRRLDAIALFERPAVPVAMIWGRDDRLIADGDTERAQGLLGDPPSASIAACGHLPMLERPENLVRLITQYSG
jgi:pimeloyl-ACP methyl ester carboxylesterase